MIDNPDSFFTPANQPVPPPGSHLPNQQQVPPPGSPQKSNRKILIIILAVVGISIACMCVCLALGAGLIFTSVNQQSGLENVVDQYMSAMAQMDAEKAYILLSARAKETISLSDLAAEMEAEVFVHYNGYQNVVIYSTSFTNSPSDNATPNPYRSDVEGTITYNNGVRMGFYATLEQESGVWKIFDIADYRQPVRKKEG
jgi:hypothetical protein